MFFLGIAVIFNAISVATADEDTDSQTHLGQEIESLISVPLLYTGNSMGVTGQRYPFPSLQTLAQLEQNKTIQITNIQSKLFIEINGWIVHSPTETFTEIIARMQSGQLQCGQQNENGNQQQNEKLLGGTYETVLTSSEVTEILLKSDLKKSTKELPLVKVSCTDEKKSPLYLLKEGINVETEPIEDFINKGIFEIRTGFIMALLIHKSGSSSEETLYSIAKPVHELSRTYANIELRKELSQNLLYVDAGNFVDGASSVVPFGLSLHRPLGFKSLELLKPVALGFGYQELIGGLPSFASEIDAHTLPYIASNWTSEDPRYTFPTSVTQNVLIGKQQVIISFVSVLDPKLHAAIPSLEQQGIRIEDPVSATQAVIDELYASKSPPNVVVVLSTASAPILEDLRRELRGAQLLIGDSTFATLRVKERQTHFLDIGTGLKAAPLTLPMDGLAETRLFFKKDDDTSHPILSSVFSRPIPIIGTAPHDPNIRREITDNRLSTYLANDIELITPTETGIHSKFSQTQWEQIVCEALRSKTKGDTVFLRGLPSSPKLPGTLSKREVADALAVMDVVEEHRIKGDRLLRFLDQSYGTTPIVCGAKPGDSSPKVKGRPIDPDQMYLIITTDLTRRSSILKNIIPAHQKSFPLDPKNSRTLQYDSETPLSLRVAVLEELETINKLEGPKNISSYLLEEAPNEKPPQWILRSRGLSLRTESFQGMEEEAFSDVPETQASSPSSSTIGYSADVAFEYSDTSIFSDLRYRSTFTELTTGEEDNEIDDDWVLSTSISAIGLSLSTGQLMWMPYSEFLYDSEYTPIELEDGSTSPFKQSDLSVRTGFSTIKWRDIRNIKVGALANRDISQLQEKPTEFAGLFQWETWSSFNSLLWTNTGEFLFYGQTKDDDSSDLRVRATADTKLSYPFSRLGSISIYGQGMAIKGRVPETASWGLAYNMGMSLDLQGAIVLRR